MIYVLKLFKPKLLHLEVVHGMVSKPQPISLTSPNPSKNPHELHLSSMATTTTDGVELTTARAWHIQHLENVPYITRKP